MKSVWLILVTLSSASGKILTLSQRKSNFPKWIHTTKWERGYYVLLRSWDNNVLGLTYWSGLSQQPKLRKQIRYSEKEEENERINSWSSFMAPEIYF